MADEREVRLGPLRLRGPILDWLAVDGTVRETFDLRTFDGQSAGVERRWGRGFYAKIAASQAWRDVECAGARVNGAPVKPAILPCFASRGPVAQR